ncbi:uncharacterized protein VNE69_03123 [Vairimorpha necatrix]|uniref:Uncharacterized protein n=1 Tax=Vairimorpha necatrix TaxID=6039 RepID=A0AAX4JAE7_9MICR
MEIAQPFSTRLKTTKRYINRTENLQYNADSTSFAYNLSENPNTRLEEFFKIKDTIDKMTLEIIQNKIEAWKEEDSKELIGKAIIHPLSNTDKEIDFKNVENQIKRIFNSFSFGMKTQLDKIKHLFAKSSLDDKLKKMFNEKLQFFVYCFDYIRKMPPHIKNTPYSIAEYIYIFKNIPKRLNILFYEFNILGKFKRFEIYLDKAQVNMLTNDEKELLREIYGKLYDLYQELESLRKCCEIATLLLEGVD